MELPLLPAPKKTSPKPKEEKIETGTLIDTIFDSGIDVINRRVFLTGEMDSDARNSNLDSVVKGLLFLDQKVNDEPIKLWINSPGGCVNDMFALYDIIQGIDSAVYTIGYGEVCSAAALILACGDKKFVTPNCWFMSHEPSLNIEEPLYTAEKRVDITKRQWSRWAALMSKHSNKTKTWWSNEIKKQREVWFGAEELVEIGVADTILERFKQ